MSDALDRLGTAVPPLFREFYETYEGTFGSTNTGFELADLYERPPTILSLTEECRDAHGWPPRYLVLTDLLGGGLLVLDAELDQVFNVDFDGSDMMLLAGELQPDWPSFAAFLEDYFAP